MNFMSEVGGLGTEYSIDLPPLQKEMNPASQETGPLPMVYCDPNMVRGTGTHPQE